MPKFLIILVFEYVFLPEAECGIIAWATLNVTALSKNALLLSSVLVRIFRVFKQWLTVLAFTRCNLFKEKKSTSVYILLT